MRSLIVVARDYGRLTALLAASLIVANAADAAEAPPFKATVERVEMIWDRAPHNAFTDLIRLKDAWYCAFREGKAHVSDDGKIRVLRSADARNWKPTALLSLEGYDLRDAGLSSTPDGRLMLIGGATVLEPKRGETGSFVSFSEDGQEWSAPQIAVEPPRWLWKVCWHEGNVYGVAYSTSGRNQASQLLESSDGVTFRVRAPELMKVGGWATEAALRFDPEGRAHIFHRRDGTPNSGYLGVADPPYRQWQWKDIGARVGGPGLIRTPDGQWLGACRLYDGRVRTSVVWLDFDKGAMVELADLPSGGDTSYPGLAWHNDKLLVSYYSSHEERASIYVAELAIQATDADVRD